MNDERADSIRSDITREVKRLYTEAEMTTSEVADLLAEVHESAASDWENK